MGPAKEYTMKEMTCILSSEHCRGEKYRCHRRMHDVNSNNRFN